MKHTLYLRNKLYITGFVILFAVIACVASVFAETPKDIAQSNIAKDRFVISWTTENAVRAQINYGTTSALGNTTHDTRGEISEGTTHYVLVAGLAASTTYYYDIVCGGIVYDNGGAHYTITTGPILPAAANSDIAYGQVFLADGVTPAKDSIVYVKLRDNNGAETNGESQLFTCLVDLNGYWYIDLKNVKTTSLSAYFEYSDGDRLVITAKSTNGGSATSAVDTAESSPTPSITIAQNNPPILDWVGMTGYENDGLDPESGSGSTVFTFKVKYADPDNEVPTIRKVYIDKNGDGDYSDPGEGNDMTTQSTDYVSGVIYSYTTTIPYSQINQSHSYYFEFSDGATFATANITQAISVQTAIHKPDIFQTLSLSIDHTDWQLLNILAGSEQITDNANKVRITNSGDGSQTYSLKIVNGGGWTSSSDKNGADIDIFVLSALFAGDSQGNINPAYFNEIGSDDVVLSNAADKATSARFGSALLSGNGVSVPVGAVRSLWFDLKAPSKDTTKGALHFIQVTISAEAS